MTLVFDTSILIEIEKKNKILLEKLREYALLYPEPAKIAFMTYYEFYYGIQEKHDKNKQKELAFLERFMILPPTKKTAHILSDLKKKYQKEGKLLPLADLLIASQIIEHEMILVTLDKGIAQIQELKKIIL